MDTKLCSKCKVIQEITNFSKREKHYLHSHCKECCKKYDKKYREKNKTKTQERTKKYRQKNKKKINKYERLKYANDKIFRMGKNLRRRIQKYISGEKIVNKPDSILGCDIYTLKEHLEKQFVIGMNWDNYGKNGWHIDHIIPLASAKNEEQLIKLCHYTNTQPLWAKDNLSKGAKLL